MGPEADAGHVSVCSGGGAGCTRGGNAIDAEGREQIVARQALEEILTEPGGRFPVQVARVNA